MIRKRALLLSLLLLATPLAAQEPDLVPFRYQSLLKHPTCKLVAVLGTPEMPPAYERNIAWDADGKFALFAHGETDPDTGRTLDSTVCLCDFGTGRILKQFTLDGTSIAAVVFTRDARKALVSTTRFDGKDKHTHRVALWDLENAKELLPLGTYKSVVGSLAFSGNERLALLGTVEGSLHLWDLEKNKELLQKKTPKNEPVLFAGFTPGGKELVAGWGNAWKLLDAATGNDVRSFEGHQSPVFNVVFSPDGKQAASATFGGEILVWDVAAGKSLAKLNLPAAELTTLAYHPQAARLAAVGVGFDATGTKEEGTAAVWDTQTLKPRWTVDKLPLKGLVPLVWQGKHELLVGGGANPWLLFHAATGKHIARGSHKSAIAGLGLSADKLLFTLGADGHSLMWPTPREPQNVLGGKDTLVGLWARPSHANVLLADSSRTLTVWDPAKNKVLKTTPGHKGTITALTQNAKGDLAASADSERVILVWEPATGNVRHTFTGHPEAINALEFTPDGKFLLSASDDATVRLWPLDKKTDDDKDPILLEGHKRQVTCMALAPDGKHLVTGSQDQTLKLWDLATRKAVRTFEGHKNWISGVRFLGPDQLVSASDDLTVRIWDVNTGKESDRLDLGVCSDCPRALLVDGNDLYIGTAGWVVLKCRWQPGR